MADGRIVTFRVQRYRPEEDEAPWYQSYDVPIREDWVVLDALNYIKDEIDGTLSFRWSCHMAVCGSCGMMINNEPMLSCKSFVRDYLPPSGPVTITVGPLNHIPVERDLISDMDYFMERFVAIKPWLIPAEARSVDDGPFQQSPKELKSFRQFSMCINCMICYAACPQVGLAEEFLGPAALAMAHRYNEDSRDAGYDARRPAVASDAGVWECSFVGACSEVCPKDVDPAAAIQRMKVASTRDWYLEHLMPWTKAPKEDAAKTDKDSTPGKTAAE